MERSDHQEARRRRKQYSALQKSTAKLRDLGVDIEASLPEIQSEMAERKERHKKEGRTPVMAVDDSDCNITLKTPPNVKKIKSRQNSAATEFFYVLQLHPYPASSSLVERTGNSLLP